MKPISEMTEPELGALRQELYRQQAPKLQIKEVQAEMYQRQKQVRAYMKTHPDVVEAIRIKSNGKASFWAKLCRFLKSLGGGGR